MTSERARGAVLYGTAAALLAGGALWWVLAAPAETADSPADRWRATAERLLPADPRQDDGETMTLAPGADQDVISPVPDGSYAVSVVCVGGPGTTARVALSRTGYDSGLGLSCGDEPSTKTFPVGLAGGLRMNVTVSEDAGPVVFRYSIRRQPI